MSELLAITGGTLIDVRTGVQHPNATVLVDGDRIAAACTRSSRVPGQPGRRLLQDLQLGTGSITTSNSGHRAPARTPRHGPRAAHDHDDARDPARNGLPGTYSHHRPRAAAIGRSGS